MNIRYTALGPLLAMWLLIPLAHAASPAVARVGDWSVTLQQLDASGEAPLYTMEGRLYALRLRKLQQMVFEHLLQLEAKARHVSVAQLLKQEVDSKLKPVTDADVSAFITKNKANLPPNGGTALQAKVRLLLTLRRLVALRGEYFNALARKYHAQITLPAPQKPAPYRHAVNGPDDLARGPANAPVTIVEFSDFQCPFCKRAEQTLRELEHQYQGKLRVVYRYFPLLPIHPDSVKAAEAAQCAAEQGKFWPYHDILFAKQNALGSPDLKKYAQGLKLNMQRFDTCLDTDATVSRVAGDVAEGNRLGVSGTPTFFINGIRLSGAQPIARFKKLIDGALQGGK
ncbi:MAG: DsbA family protein [Gammaproteobacteria bacterium]|nr:DsbA family protein [Gammaproteobacteria bacterium]